MGDEFQTNISGVNWWDSSRKNRFDIDSSSTSTTFSSIGSFGWANEAARSSMDSSVSVSGTSSVNFQENQKLSESDPTLQMMGLGLPSQAADWNQSMLRGAKAEGSFQSMLQEDPMNSNPTFQQEIQWRPKIFSVCGEVSSMNQAISNNFQIDNTSAVYGESPSNNNVLQSLFGPNHQPQQPNLLEGRSIDYPYAASSYGMNTNELLQHNSISKFPQFMRDSPPKNSPHTQLQFSNNGQYWNPSASPVPDVRSRFLPSLQPQFPSPNSTFEEKPKISSEIRDSSRSAVKKSGNEVSTKRSRNETTSTLPPFKVRKEKMGDRITALQQLVSPFGKTDTASVLSEAIEYIKFLHEQVSILSTPYMKNGAPMQHYQHSGKSKDLEGPKQGLRSRGLCLVPVSSTFPVTHDQTTVDFWNPTFGGSFR